MNGFVIHGRVNPKFIEKAEPIFVKLMEGLESIMKICESPMEFGYNLGILAYGVVRTIDNVYCGENSATIKVSLLSAIIMKMKDDGFPISMLKEISKEESEKIEKIQDMASKAQNN